MRKPLKRLPSLKAAKLISLDVETSDPELKSKGPGVRRDGRLVGISIAVDEGPNFYLPFGHSTGNLYDREKVLAWARRELCRPNQPKVGANLLYDLDFLAEAGVNVTGPFFDIQVAEPLLDENRDSFSLDTLAEHYLGERKKTDRLDDLVEARGLKGDSRAHIAELPGDFVAEYAEADADLALRVFHAQRARLDEEGLGDLFALETGLVPLLLAMRRRGVRVDKARAEEVRDDLLARLDGAQARLNALAGFAVNVNAAASIKRGFEKFGLRPGKTAKGSPSFTHEVLESVDHDFARAVLAARKIEKLVGTFVESAILGTLIGDRIHCQFNQLKSDDSGAVTGRFSSSNPNLQQIPSRDSELAPLIRGLFVPEPGELWGRADYSQIEYRFLAHYGSGRGAEDVREAYRNDPKTDFHAVCAERAKTDRKKAKNLNFAVVYGAGKKKVAAYLGITIAEAEAFLENYHGELPFIRETYRLAAARAERRGYIKTILGRRRRFVFWEASDFAFSKKLGVARSRAEIVDRIDAARAEAVEAGERPPKSGVRRAFTYKALNALLQGSSADMTKKAMLDLWGSGVCSVLGPPLLTVHDELDFSVPNTKIGREAFGEAVQIMANTIKLKIPVYVDGGLGENWGACK